MAGGFSVVGLISGIDSDSLIRQIIQLERAPIRRLQGRVESLNTQREQIGELRSQLFNFRNILRDFQLGLNFGAFASESTSENVATATAGSSPLTGSFSIDVQQWATATEEYGGGPISAPIDPTAPLENSGIANQIQAGTFSINGVQISVDPATDSLNDVFNAINSSGAGVTASLDPAMDRVVIENSTAGDTTVVNFGATGDTSNLLSVFGVEEAFQSTGASGSTIVTGNRPLGGVESSDLLGASRFARGPVSAGTFQINGVSIAVDPTTDTLDDLLSRINASDANVRASFDRATDSIRVVSESLGSRTISFASGTSNFLDITNLTTATQTAGQDAQFSVDGGPAQFSNSNDVTSAIPGVTVSLRGVGATTITVSPDTEANQADVQEFVDAFNEAVLSIRELTGEDGPLENDSSIRSISNFLRSGIFERVPGIPGSFESLLDIGISSGDTFDSSAPFQLSLDAARFAEAIAQNPGGVEQLFTNDDGTGIVDTLFDFVDAAAATNGFLNSRSRAGGSIDNQIDSIETRIDNLERTIGLREERLRRQFIELERVTSSLQSQGGSLSTLAGQFGSI